MIENLTRNNNFFADKSLQMVNIIDAVDFDLEFNNIAEYFNKILVPAINEIVKKVVEVGDNGQFLVNIGDGTTLWKGIIVGDNIHDYTIGFNKLAACNSGSVLIAGVNNNFAAITPTAANQVLTSYGSWRVLNSNDIVDNSITGQQLGNLNRNCFAVNTALTKVPDNSIDTSHIENYSITADKIKDGTITANNLGLFPNLTEVYQASFNPYRTVPLLSSFIADGAITGDKIKSPSIPVVTTTYSPNKLTIKEAISRDKNVFLFSIIWGQSLIEGNKFPYSLHNVFYAKILGDRHIKSESITDDSLMAFDPANHKYEGLIHHGCMISEFKLPAAKIAKGLLKKEDFDDEVQKALAKFGI